MINKILKVSNYIFKALLSIMQIRKEYEDDKKSKKK